MVTSDLAHPAVRMIERSENIKALRDNLSIVSREMGFDHFAVALDSTIPSKTRLSNRLHNYPRDWEAVYDRRKIGGFDPVHRACRSMLRGFLWSELPQLVSFSDRDADLLVSAKSYGLGDGLTVPANVAGGFSGSVTFVVGRGRSVTDNLLLAQHIGLAAFQTFSSIANANGRQRLPRLTPRQLEAVMWVGRGLTDADIGSRMGISVHGVIKHLRLARALWGATTRSSLPILALRDGYLFGADYDD